MAQVIWNGAGGVALVGTLELPKAKAARHPALVLVAGSGPTDRDGNQLPAIRTDLLAQLAAALAEKGIASLRYDKRGIGASGQPKKPGDFAMFFDWENFVADVEAAAAFLKKHPRIDPKRVGLLGHSEGGLLCLEAAARVRPAALVLAATPGRRTGDVLTDQLAALLKTQKATPEQTEFFLSENARIVAAIQKTGKVPGDVPPGLAALYPAYLGPFLQGMLSCDPVRLAKKIIYPALVLQGERDQQVSAVRDARPLAAALGSRGKRVVVPGASHNFKRKKDTFTGPVAPEALTALTAWATRSL